MATLRGKTLFITGASRGIGRAIALRCARDGANIVVTAKSATPHPKLPGTIHTVATEVAAAGGKALAIQLDVRDDAAIAGAVQQAAAHFGGIDVLVNNASAIQLTNTPDTPAKRFDLMFGVNVRGTFLCSQACLPYLAKAANPHILNLAPPLSMKTEWFQGHVAYTMAKYGMSLCVLGMADEYAGKVGVNALWPRTAINTAAVRNHLGGEMAVRAARQPEIMADAAHWILTRPQAECSGNFFIDDEVVRQAGVTDLSVYKVDPQLSDDQLLPDFFLD